MENKHQPGTIESLSFHQEARRILQAMHKETKFQAVVLTSPEGLSIITVPANYGGDVAAAIAGMLRRVSDRAQSQLGMGEMDEVIISDHDHNRLVCRYLPDGKKGLILAVIVPPGCPYRRATNRAIWQIKQLLS